MANGAKCVWLTGLPCAGKTTIGKLIVEKLPNSVLLDGDELRATALGKNVGFSPEDRANHIRRMGAIAKLMVDNGISPICTFVSPEAAIRDEVAELFEPGDFKEVWVDTPADVCAERDVKGMWAKAKAGEIKGFTGYDAPYEIPEAPHFILPTAEAPDQEVPGLIEAEYLIEQIFPKSKPACFFIGRWNGVFHNGHDHIIQKKLDEGFNVTMAVRDVPPDEGNPWHAREVKKMLDYRFKDDDRVKVIIIPDVHSVEYGRGVGYEVNEIKVTEQIAGISGTECRRLMAEGDESWKEFVPKEIAEYLSAKG